MDVTKVVELVARIPKNWDLYFSDFSTILYGIYKIAVFENKRKKKRTFASRPLDFYFFSREALGGGNRTGEGLRRRFPARFGPGGEGEVGEKGEGFESYLPVVAVGVGMAGGDGTTNAGDRRRCCVTAVALRRLWRWE